MNINDIEKIVLMKVSGVGTASCRYGHFVNWLWEIFAQMIFNSYVVRIELKGIFG